MFYVEKYITNSRKIYQSKSLDKTNFSQEQINVMISSVCKVAVTCTLKTQKSYNNRMQNFHAADMMVTMNYLMKPYTTK